MKNKIRQTSDFKSTNNYSKIEQNTSAFYERIEWILTA